VLFARHDSRGEDDAMIGISLEHARSYNGKGYGIFRTVNEFEGKRQIACLKQINAWYVEIDGGDKKMQLERIRKTPIYPTRVVESKNGYHLYFNAIEALLDNYAQIMHGLRFHFKGDSKAKDVARVLREPGFYHWKDPNNPFMVREIFVCEARYREKDMLHFFPPPREEVIEMKAIDVSTYEPSGEETGLTAFLDGLDNEDALSRLSGTKWVNGEVYSFKKVSRGRSNIFVNGKSTSCFIDERGRIGATPGGPNIWCWLRYFGHSEKEIVAIIQEIYPGVRI
jgi:hypothetical protein